MILHWITSFIRAIYCKCNNANNWICNTKPVVKFVIKNACIIYKNYVISNFKNIWINNIIKNIWISKITKIKYLNFKTKYNYYYYYYKAYNYYTCSSMYTKVSNNLSTNKKIEKYFIPSKKSWRPKVHKHALFLDG